MAPPELPACFVQVAIPAQRAKIRQIIGSAMSQRDHMIYLHSRRHPAFSLTVHA
jgi:hypothetical protein